MRIPIIMIPIALSLVCFAAEAQAGKGRSSEVAHNTGAGVCDALRGGTPGLFGLCEAYCAPRNQAHVDMNDISSVRAAAPSLSLLEKYNALKTDSDPGMPCHVGGGDPEPSDLPAPTACACWTPEQLQAIDGNYEPARGMTPGAHCTLNSGEMGIYEAQVYDGYNIGATNETVVSSAFAYFDPNDASVQGCMFQSPTQSFVNFPLEHRAEAEFCIQMIAVQCESIP